MATDNFRSWEKALYLSQIGGAYSPRDPDIPPLGSTVDGWAWSGSTVSTKNVPLTTAGNNWVREPYQEPDTDFADHPGDPIVDTLIYRWRWPAQTHPTVPGVVLTGDDVVEINILGVSTEVEAISVNFGTAQPPEGGWTAPLYNQVICWLEDPVTGVVPTGTPDFVPDFLGGLTAQNFANGKAGVGLGWTDPFIFFGFPGWSTGFFSPSFTLPASYANQAMDVVLAIVTPDPDVASVTVQYPRGPGVGDTHTRWTYYLPPVELDIDEQDCEREISNTYVELTAVPDIYVHGADIQGAGEWFKYYGSGAYIADNPQALITGGSTLPVQLDFPESDVQPISTGLPKTMWVLEGPSIPTGDIAFLDTQWKLLNWTSNIADLLWITLIGSDGYPVPMVPVKHDSLQSITEIGLGNEFIQGAENTLMRTPTNDPYVAINQIVAYWAPVNLVDTTTPRLSTWAVEGTNATAEGTTLIVSFASGSDLFAQTYPRSWECQLLDWFSCEELVRILRQYPRDDDLGAWSPLRSTSSIPRGAAPSSFQRGQRRGTVSGSGYW